MSSIGPALPPHLQKSQAAPDSDSDDDDYGPALPPHLQAARQQGPSLPPASAAGPSRPSGPIAGPTFPSYDNDSDDDDVGPRPPRPGEEDSADGVREFIEREQRWAKEREEASKPKVLEREAWMTMMPESSDLASTLDPLKLKARSFAKQSSAPVKEQDRTLWTETPAERKQRLIDESMGKKRKATDSGPPVDESERDAQKRRRRRDEEIAATIREHNDAHRSAPLLATHAASVKSKPKTDEPVIWDRDLHMGVTGKLMEDKERLKQIRDARGLGDRFGHGKGGAYS